MAELIKWTSDSAETQLARPHDIWSTLSIRVWIRGVIGGQSIQTVGQTTGIGKVGRTTIKPPMSVKPQIGLAQLRRPESCISKLLLKFVKKVFINLSLKTTSIGCIFSLIVSTWHVSFCGRQVHRRVNGWDGKQLIWLNSSCLLQLWLLDLLLILCYSAVSICSCNTLCPTFCLATRSSRVYNWPSTIPHTPILINCRPGYCRVVQEWGNSAVVNCIALEAAVL